MSVNSSFNSSDSSLHLSRSRCSDYTSAVFNFTAFTVVNVLLLPLYMLVLCMGFRRSALATTHSDVFTYNVVALEMMSTLGCCIYCAGAFTGDVRVVLAGTGMFLISSPGQTLFHLLTCADRYLAVIRPVTYLGLRQAAGLRIRNITIGGVWLICFASLCVGKMITRFFYTIVVSCLLVFSLIVVSFCSLSVLCALIGPGPGDVGGDRNRVDQTKRRAFYSIIVIMGALMFRFVGMLVANMTYVSAPTYVMCFMEALTMWWTLPNSLVLPLLFLHRAGKLPGCRVHAQRAA